MNSTTLASAVGALSLITAVNCSAPAQESTSSSQLFDAWSNVRVTEGEDPHAYGIDVELWKHHAEFLGFLSEHVGPVADPPVGQLESIVFDEKTGAISFVAKLSVGVVRSERDKAWIPAKNRYEFQGVIDRSTMAGTLRRTLVHDDGTETTDEDRIALNSRSAADRAHGTSQSYEEWIDGWNRILSARGPKW